jgi:hypothetical protein
MDRVSTDIIPYLQIIVRLYRQLYALPYFQSMTASEMTCVSETPVVLLLSDACR